MKLCIKRNELVTRLTDQISHQVSKEQRAEAGWRQQFRAAVEQLNAQLDAGQWPDNVYRIFADLGRPAKFSTNLERTLRMIKLDNREVIELEEDEYAKLVEGAWEELASWASSNWKYLAP